MTTPHAGRIERLRALLDQRGVDGLLVSQPESRYYLSGYTGHDLPPRDSAGYLLITRNKALLLTDPRTNEQAAGEAPEYEVVTYAAGARGPEQVALSAAALGIKRLAFETIHLPWGIWREVGKHLDGTGVEWADVDSFVDELRVIKDAAELAELQASIDVLDRCFAHVAGWIKPGMSERQVAREVDRYLSEYADGTAFPSIVASGPNGSMPHAVPTDRVIQEGEAITLDIGALVRGYCSDMTRTIVLGEPRDPRLQEVYDLVLEAQAVCEHDVRPGMTGRDGDSLSREVIKAANQGDYFTHSTGHGIGLEVHEPPWLSQVRGDEPLRAGMVFSVEPGVYVPGWGGVRIEDLVVLEETGARVLSQSPRTLRVQ